MVFQHPQKLPDNRQKISNRINKADTSREQLGTCAKMVSEGLTVMPLPSVERKSEGRVGFHRSGNMEGATVDRQQKLTTPDQEYTVGTNLPPTSHQKEKSSDSRLGGNLKKPNPLQEDASTAHGCRLRKNLKVQVLQKKSISDYIKKILDSADSNMGIMEGCSKRMVRDGALDRATLLEIQKIDGACRFLDGLLDGRTFISLPPDCTLEGARSLLEQIELAEGVQAIAIRLEDEDELYEADTLTSPPRLYLALTDNGRQIDGDFDRQFVEILNGLTISCNLLPVEPIINMDEPASLVSDSGLEKFEATEEEEEITFPSLDISSDTAPPPALATTPPATTATSDSKIGHQGKETLKIEIPTRRSYSVPEILSVPLTHHQIVSAWKNTSMPPWMTCTHFHHVHGGGESYQEERQVEREPETPELSSPTSSITTIMDTQLVTPILSEAPQSLYIHSREFSTDTVITAATSVHSDAEMQERKLHLESEDYKSKQELQRRDPFGLGILIHGMDQARSRAGPPTSATDEEHLAKIAPTSASVNHVHHQEPLQNTMEACPTVSSTFDTNKPNRHMYERNEIMLVSSGDGMLVEKQSKLPLRLLSAGSSKSIIRGGLRPLPQRGVPYYKLEQPPCNRHYLLDQGCLSLDCPYAHDYLLTPFEIEKLRNDSKKSPCIALKNGKKCFMGTKKCHMGHFCPYGRECRYGYNCRFLNIPGAHDGNPVNERSANTARSQEGELTISIIQNAIPKLPSYSPPITPPSTADGQSSRRSEIGNNFSSDLMIPKQGYRFPVLPPPPLMAMEFNIPMNPPSHTQPIAALLSLPPPPPLGFLPHPVLFGTLPVHAQLPPPPFAMDPSGRIMLPQMQDLPSPTSVKIAQGPPLPAEHTRNATIPATSLQSLVPVMDPQTRVTLSPSVPTKSFRNQTSECPTPQRNGIKTIPDAERVVTKSATPLTFREQEDCEPPHTKSPKKKKPSRKPFVRRSPGDLTQPVSASEECSDAIGSQ